MKTHLSTPKIHSFAFIIWNNNNCFSDRFETTCAQNYSIAHTQATAFSQLIWGVIFILNLFFILFYFISFFFVPVFRARSFTLTRLFSFQINVKCVLLHMCGQFHTTDPNHMIKAINNVTILLLQICLNSPLVCLAGCWNFSFSHRSAPCLNETKREIKRKKKRTYTKYKWKRKHVVAFNALCIAEWWKRSADIITYLNLKMHKQDMNKMK